VIEVSDSDDDEVAAAEQSGLAEADAAGGEQSGLGPRQAHAAEAVEAVCASLRGSFVFKGIPENLLHEVGG
jgi:hypothetical protein